MPLRDRWGCLWRITELDQNHVFFGVLILGQEARCRHPFGSFDRHRRPASTAGRPPFRRCPVGARPTSTTHPPSRPQACSQPAPRRAYPRRCVPPFPEPGTAFTFRHRPAAFHAAAAPPRADKTEVPQVIFGPAQASAWSKRTASRTHRRHRCKEMAESQLGWPANGAAARLGLRCRDRQGCGAAHSGHS
jgi:hypothetical protein